MGRLRTSNGGRTAGKSGSDEPQPISDKERRRLRRKMRKQQSTSGINPRRLTEAGALELAIALAQYFYYELDNPILTDGEYDKLEVRYIRYKKESGSPGGVTPDILDHPGSGASLRKWIEEWRK